MTMSKIRLYGFYEDLVLKRTGLCLNKLCMETRSLSHYQVLLVTLSILSALCVYSTVNADLEDVSRWLKYTKLTVFNFLRGYSVYLSRYGITSKMRLLIVLACCESDLTVKIMTYMNLDMFYVLFRHGDRTPIDPYPNDPYRNLSLWPVDWGQLTTIGEKQHFNLGRWLRKRYKNFLPEKYSHEDIHVRSTDVDRTLMSAECNLAGLYFPGPSQQFNPDIKWQPIPVHTVPEKSDHILAAKKWCPAYDADQDKVKQSPEIVELNKKNAPLYAYLTLHSGRNVKDVTDVEYLYNTLFIEELYNFSLPTWTAKVYPHKLKPLADFSFVLPTLTKTSKRLKTGPLLGEMISRMQKKLIGNLTEGNKLTMYSAHDTTIANFLNTLGVFGIESPPYVATVLIELRTNIDDMIFVTVSYKNSTEEEPFLLTVPGCKQLCPFSIFSSLMEPLIPKNWEAECIVPTIFNLYLYFGNISSNSLLLHMSLVFISVAVIFIIYCCCRSRLPREYWYRRVSSTDSSI